MWGYPLQGTKIVHEQMLHEALEQRAVPRREKRARCAPLKHLFGAAQAHFTTTSAGKPQAVLLRCDGEG